MGPAPPRQRPPPPPQRPPPPPPPPPPPRRPPQQPYRHHQPPQGPQQPQQVPPRIPTKRPPERPRSQPRLEKYGPTVLKQARARLFKLGFGVVLEECFDEREFFLKFEPLVYLKTSPIMAKYIVPLSKGRYIFWYVTDEGKILIRSLLLILFALHEAGFCLKWLNLDMLAITWDGRVELRKDRVVLEKATPQGINDNYSSAADVIEKLISESQGSHMVGKLSEDWYYLLKLMRTSGYAAQYLILTNVALLSMSSRGAVFKKFYEDIRKILPRDGCPLLLNKILCAIRLVGKYWSQIACNNHTLKGWFMFRSRKWKSYQGTSMIDFVDFIRNVDSHRMDWKSYTDIEIDMLVYACFPMLWCVIQYEFFSHDSAGRLHIEENFNDGNFNRLRALAK